MLYSDPIDVEKEQDQEKEPRKHERTEKRNEDVGSDWGKGEDTDETPTKNDKSASLKGDIFTDMCNNEREWSADDAKVSVATPPSRDQIR